MKSLALQDFLKNAQNGAKVIDIRETGAAVAAFIPDSILLSQSIDLDERLHYLPHFLEKDQAFLLVGENEADAQKYGEDLKKAGYSRCNGFLAGGFSAFQDSNERSEMLIVVSPFEVAVDHKFSENAAFWDIRKKADFESGSLKKAIHKEVEDIIFNEDEIEPFKTHYLFDEHGDGAACVASILKGFRKHNFYLIENGFEGIRNSESMKDYLT